MYELLIHKVSMHCDDCFTIEKSINHVLKFFFHYMLYFKRIFKLRLRLIYTAVDTMHASVIGALCSLVEEMLMSREKSSLVDFFLPKQSK